MKQIITNIESKLVQSFEAYQHEIEQITAVQTTWLKEIKLIRFYLTSTFSKLCGSLQVNVPPKTLLRVESRNTSSRDAQIFVDFCNIDEKIIILSAVRTSLKNSQPVNSFRPFSTLFNAGLTSEKGNGNGNGLKKTKQIWIQYFYHRVY